MTMTHSRWQLLITAALVLTIGSHTIRAHGQSSAESGSPPAVGDTADDFTLEALDGKQVRLWEMTKQGPVVLIVLRGFPGYQCPICSAQVAALRAKASEFADARAKVLLVYPGPSDALKERAEEFLKAKALPEGFQLLLDPDYTFTSAYHLRWDAPRETAYPSTFVVGADNRILYAKVSKTHGGRSRPEEILAALAGAP